MREAPAVVDQGPDTLLDGRYRLISVLGRGAMAVVYRAKQESMGRDVAVKVLLPEVTASPAGVRRMLREAQLVAGLDHPNIVTVHDFGQVAGRPFIVMEWVRGQSLQRLLTRAGKLQPENAVPIFVQIAQALQAAHEAGIVHRDIKPANILVDHLRDGTTKVKVTDFGVATTRASDPTHPGALVGTPAYMSPEQARGLALDARADLYSLGVVMFGALTGELPYDAPDALAVAVAQVTRPVPSFDAVAPDHVVPARLEAIVRRCLEKDPDDRYDSAASLIADLTSADVRSLWEPGEPTSAETLEDSPHELPTTVPALRPERGRAQTALLIAVAAVALAVTTATTIRASAPRLLVHRVAVAGDAQRVWLVDRHSHRVSVPGAVPVGSYEVVALFPDGPPTAAGPITVERPSVLRCASSTSRCVLDP